MPFFRKYTAIALLLQLFVSVSAFAEVADPPATPPPVSLDPAPGWRWRRASPPEYLLIPLGAGATLYTEIQNGKPTKANWTSRNAFDEGIRDALRLESLGGREAAQTASNAIMAVMIAAPLADTYMTLGWRDARWDAFWQTEMINLESFTLTSVVSSIMQNSIKRERPFVRNCQGGHCEGDQINRGMPSGHMAFAFTGAGLLCTHHTYQALYNDATADDAVCYAGLGVATAEGFLRVMSDRHYATDVLAGTGIGLFSGFLLPRLLHYWHPSSALAANSEETILQRLTVAPAAYNDGAGVLCSLRF